MEDSGSEPFRQSILKMKRWFGNMLRNNGRAIRLMGTEALWVVVSCESAYLYVDQFIGAGDRHLGGD